MRRHVRWPEGKTICATFTVALEAYTKAGHFKTLEISNGPNLFSISHADYGGNAGIWRVMEILERATAPGQLSTSTALRWKSGQRQQGRCRRLVMNSRVMAIPMKSR